MLLTNLVYNSIRRLSNYNPFRAVFYVPGIILLKYVWILKIKKDYMF